MDRQVDARGLACPEPVICTKKALDSMVNGMLVTIVDNPVARDNVVKFAKSQNCNVEVEEKGQEFHVRILKGDPAPQTTGMNTMVSEAGNWVLLMGSHLFGRGDEALGKILMKSYLFSLIEAQDLPATIMLVNSAVQLVVEGSEVLEHFLALQNKGVEILACGTCLDFYNLKEKLCVGQITNMYTIVDKMGSVVKVVTL